MYGNKSIFMTTLNETSNTGWGGSPYWGLVQQNGPWKTVPIDRIRARQGVGRPIVGGGIGAGGTRHAGHGNYEQVLTPYQVDGRGPVPDPSSYASRSVMTPVEMKREQKMGIAKNGLTRHARTPFQTGHKMGSARALDIMQIEAEIRPLDIMKHMEGSLITEHRIKESPKDHANILQLHYPVKEIPVAHFNPPHPSPDQSKASEQARADERKSVMSHIDMNPPTEWQQVASGIIGRKRGGAEFTARKGKKIKGTEKPEKESSLGKRKAPAEKEEKRKEQKTSHVTQKRKGEKMMSEKFKHAKKEESSELKKRKGGPLMSEKFKQQKGAKPAKISTSNLGPKFGAGRAEKKSAPKKFDELPAVRPKRG